MAMLKGYIERTLADWQVDTLDLNLWCFDYVIAALARREIHLTPEALARIGTDLDGLLHAAAVFKGRDRQAFFGDGAQYDECARPMLEFTELFSGIVNRHAEEWESSGRLSPLLQALVGRIAAAQPDVLGVSAIFSHQLPIGAMLGRYFRQARNIRVIFGGGCFTSGVSAFLDWYPEAADAVVSGDGEDALQALLANGVAPVGVAGAWYRRDGRVDGLPPVYRQDVDSFGLPDFSGYALHAYYSPQPVVPLLLSRGCYWRRCTFCVHYFSAGDSYRIRSLDQVIAMLRQLVGQGVRHFSLVDEMIAPGYFVQLADAIREAGLDIAYYALSKPNKSFTPRVLDRMAASGCRYLLWGMESACQRVLDLMDKGTRPDEMATVFRNSQAAGIANHVYVICGFPSETAAEFAQTIDFLRDHRSLIAATHRSVFALEVGSPIQRDAARFGITETWELRKTPLGSRLGYRTANGMSMEEARQVFTGALPFLKNFPTYARYLANYRDHALLVYDHHRRNSGPG